LGNQDLYCKTPIGHHLKDLKEILFNLKINQDKAGDDGTTCNEPPFRLI
jgi:hypothetical protein